MLQGLSRAMPFLGIAVIVYAVGVLALGIPVENPVAAVPLPSGGLLRIVFGDGVVLLSLVLFFVELLISTRPTRSSLVNHGLSMALFVLCLVLFLLVPAFGTMTFFLITLLTLIDVISGYSISIITARRDLTLEREV
jgi:hypothetical protein